MSDTPYPMEEIEVPAGAFIGWAATPGQQIKGYVTSYAAADGTDFAGRACPQLSVELTEAAYSVNKEGARADFDAGDDVTITAGQANLKRTIQGGHLNPGDYIELTYADTTKTANGTVKLFKLGVARGARPVANAPTPVTPPAQEPATGKPPF